MHTLLCKRKAHICVSKGGGIATYICVARLSLVWLWRWRWCRYRCASFLRCWRLRVRLANLIVWHIWMSILVFQTPVFRVHVSLRVRRVACHRESVSHWHHWVVVWMHPPWIHAPLCTWHRWVRHMWHVRHMRRHTIRVVWVWYVVLGPIGIVHIQCWRPRHPCWCHIDRCKKFLED